MSKSFVIKNKEGKYWQWLFNNKTDWEDELYNAFMHYSRKDAEKSIHIWGLNDCEIVEITITEGNLDAYIDNLQDERDFERRDKTLIVKQLNDPNDYVIREEYIQLEHENKALKEQLAEKDKIIKQLNFEKRNTFGLIKKVSDKGQLEIRKQICDEVRKIIDYYSEWHEQGYVINMRSEDLLKEIDIIKQPKENKK